MTYSAKFLPLLLHILYPLNSLLRKNVQWKWTEEKQKSFDAAKALVSDRQYLAHYDVSKPLKVYCDTSPKGVGACLTQYLYGRKFILVTDHQPLCKIFGGKGVPSLAAARIQCWALLLGAYQFSIQHILGKLNVCARQQTRPLKSCNQCLQFTGYQWSWPFRSEEFKSFVEENGILHQRVPPYHPASNGAAENLVKSVKRLLEKGKTTDSLEMKLAEFLSTYRNTPHTVTGRTPAEILLDKALHTWLSLVYPCLSQALSAKSELKVSSTLLKRNKRC